MRFFFVLNTGQEERFVEELAGFLGKGSCESIAPSVSFGIFQYLVSDVKIARIDDRFPGTGEGGDQVDYPDTLSVLGERAAGV